MASRICFAEGIPLSARSGARIVQPEELKRKSKLEEAKNLTLADIIRKQKEYKQQTEKQENDKKRDDENIKKQEELEQ